MAFIDEAKLDSLSTELFLGLIYDVLPRLGVARG